MAVKTMVAKCGHRACKARTIGWECRVCGKRVCAHHCSLKDGDTAVCVGCRILAAAIDRRAAQGA